MKNALLIFVLLLLSSASFAQNNNQNSPTIYLGSTASGDTYSGSSKLVMIHTSQETAHDSTYSILDTQISIGDKVYRSMNSTNRGLLLTDEMAKSIQLLKSGESFSLVMTVKGSDGIFRKVAGVFYV